MDKIPGSGSGSGRVGVSKIRSGISGYLFFFRVFPGISGISGYVGYFRVFLVIFLHLLRAEKIATKPNWL